MLAILEKMEYIEFLDKIIKLGYVLVIPSLLWKHELKDNPAHDLIIKYINEGKIIIIDLNTMDDIIKFQQEHDHMDLGESDVILTYIKLIMKGIKICCALDEKRARTVAKELKIDFIGIVGLLLSLKEKKIIPLQKIKEITDTLIKNEFRLSRDLIESLKSD